MRRFSVVTCVSRPDVYENCVLKSMRRKYDGIEYIPVSNSRGKYSAANALNVGIESAKSDFVVLCHQDISIVGDDWFIRLNNIIDNLQDGWAIIGTAGINIKASTDEVGPWGGPTSSFQPAVGTIWNDEDTFLPPYWCGTTDVSHVHAVDECCYILNKATFLRHDTMFHGFHFYGIDLCLTARASGYAVYAAELPMIHFGRFSGSVRNDQRYWYFLRMLHKKWSYKFRQLFTTHMHWVDDRITSYLRFGLSSELTNIKVKSIGIDSCQIDEAEFNTYA